MSKTLPSTDPLKPCPFCSGSPLTETFDVGSRFTATVECEDCGAHLAAADGTDSGAIQQVVAAWNTRSELQPEEAPC